MKRSLIAVAAFCAAFSVHGDLILPEVSGPFNETPRVIWKNVKLVELTRFYASVSGRSEPDALGMTANWFSPGRFVRYNANGELEAQFAVRESKQSQLKCCKLVFTQDRDDITVKMEYAKYTSGINTDAQVETVDFDTRGNSYNYSIGRLVAFRAGRDRRSFPWFLPAGKVPASLAGWTADDLRSIGEWRAVISGSRLRVAQTALGYFVSSRDGSADVQFQSFQNITDFYTRFARVSFNGASDGVSATLQAVAFGGVNSGVGYPGQIDLRDKVEGWNSQNIVASESELGVSLRNITGGKTVVRRSGLRYGYLPREETVLFRNFSLENVIDVSAKMHGAGSERAGVYHLRYDAAAKKLTGQLQAVHGGLAKCVIFEFRQNGEDVSGKLAGARFRSSTVAASPGFAGYDFETQTCNEMITIAQKTGDGGYGMFDFELTAFDPGSGAVAWTGDGAGDWSDGSNWSTGRAPEAGDVAVFTNATEAVTVTGADFPVSAIVTTSSHAPVTIAGGVRIDGDFEPSVSDGGLTVVGVAATGAVAPRGRGILRLEGNVAAQSLSLGNAIHREDGQDPEKLYGFTGAAVYEIGGDACASYDYLGLLNMQPRDIMRLAGNNTIKQPVLLPAGAVVAIASGRTDVPDLTPIGDGVRIYVHEGAEFLVQSFTNLYKYPLSFEGAGRISFGADGYPSYATNIIDGVTIATCGSDYDFLGAVTSSVGTVTVSPVDLDGTERTIKWAGAILGDAGVSVRGGGTFVLSDGSRLNALSVGAGCRIAAAGDASAATLDMDANGTVVLGSGGCLTLADVDVDFSTMKLAAADDARCGVVMRAKSFSNFPAYITAENDSEARYIAVISQVDGLASLELLEQPKGLTISIR